MMLFVMSGCNNIQEKEKSRLELFMDKLENMYFKCNRDNLSCIYENEDLTDNSEVYDSRWLKYYFDFNNYEFEYRFRIFSSNRKSNKDFEDDRSSIYNYKEDKYYSAYNGYRYDCQSKYMKFYPYVGSSEQTFDCANAGNYNIYSLDYTYSTICQIVEDECDKAYNIFINSLGDFTISDLLSKNN